MGKLNFIGVTKFRGISFGPISREKLEETVELMGVLVQEIKEKRAFREA